MTNSNSLSDITIIGGGPTGLFAAFYAGLRGMKVKLIESLPQLGGQLAALYPEKFIYDIAGLPRITAQDLVDNLILQCKPFNIEFVLGEKVLELHKEEQSFELITDKGTHHTKSIIITAGCGAFEPRRLPLSTAPEYEEKGLHYFVNNKQYFENRRVLIAGGGDSALDWSLMLAPIAANVTLTHRRDLFRGHEHTLEQVKQAGVQVLTPYVIEEITGDGHLSGARLRNSTTEQQTDLPIDELIVSYGFLSTLGPLADWPIELQQNKILVNTHMQTSLPGVYAAGDITTYPGKVKLIAVGFGEAPTAVNNAYLYLNPSARLQPGHSSNLKL